MSDCFLAQISKKSQFEYLPVCYADNGASCLATMTAATRNSATKLTHQGVDANSPVQGFLISFHFSGRELLITV